MKSERLSYRLYRKAQRKYVKEMKKLLKDSGPFEWDFMWRAIGLMVKRRFEYFDQGFNVWQIEESAKQTRDELQTAVELWDRATNFEYLDEKEFKKIIKEKGLAGFQEMIDNKLKYTEEELKIRKKQYKEESKQEQQNYVDFFIYLAKHMRGWWD